MSFPNLYVLGETPKLSSQIHEMEICVNFKQVSLCENLMMISYASKSALYIIHCFCLWAVNSA